jgi:predicted permease
MRLFHDLRYALRMLRKDSVFTLVAVLSLALGTGANATMFSLVNGILFRPLPVSRASEILTIAPRSPKDPFDAISYPDYADFRDRTQTMTDLVASALYRFGFSPTPEALPKVKYGLLVSGNLFQAMEVTPALGRFFRPDESIVPGRDAVLVLGYDFWMDEFGGDPTVIGRTVQLNDLNFIIIGVAPETFTGMDEFFKATMFVPVMMAPRLSADPNNNLLVNRDWDAFVVKGRVKSGISASQAEAELAGIAKGLEETYPAADGGKSVALRTETQLHLQHLPQESGFMIMAMIMAGLVLLTSCFNVANLLLSRARTREVAVRLALGAGRTRLVRQLLMESLLLAVGGAITGVWFGWIAAQLFSRIKVPSDLPFMMDFKADYRVFVFTLTVGILSVLFFGLAPAWMSSQVDLVSALKATDDAGSVRKRVLWGRNLLVVGQIAISVVLLVATAVVYRGFKIQLFAGAGFRTSHLLTMSFDPRLVRYSDAQVKEFYRQLIPRVATTSGVKSVTMAAIMPLAITQRSFSVDVGREATQSSKERTTDHILYNVVDEGFFNTLAVPIVRGRGFLASDKQESSPVVVINEVLAEKYWPGDDPIGKRIEIDTSAGQMQWAEVVGVAKTCKYVWMTEGPTNYLYLPLAQYPRTQRVLIAEASGDPASLTTPLRQTIRDLNPNMPLFDVRTMEDFFTTWVVGSADNSIAIVGAMGMTGLILAMIGLYGLVTYSVSRRTREFGIRMAVGASRAGVLAMVLHQGAKLCIAGVTIGLVLSLPASHLLSAFVFTAKTDWVPYLEIPIILIGVTLFSTLGPARRAATIDPMKALRDE